MSNKMEPARKLENNDDVSSSRPRNALDLSIACPTDSQILDDQTVRDILETGPYALPIQPVGDDGDKIEATDTCIPYDDLTSNSQLLDAISLLERESEDVGPFGTTSAIKIYPFVRTQRNWLQRIFGWLRRN